MLENDPGRIAAEMTSASGIETIAAIDGMEIEI
jgi:hypothetical protein